MIEVLKELKKRGLMSWTSVAKMRIIRILIDC